MVLRRASEGRSGIVCRLFSSWIYWHVGRCEGRDSRTEFPAVALGIFNEVCRVSEGENRKAFAGAGGGFESNGRQRRGIAGRNCKSVDAEEEGCTDNGAKIARIELIWGVSQRLGADTRKAEK